MSTLIYPSDADQKHITFKVTAVQNTLITGTLLITVQKLYSSQFSGCSGVEVLLLVLPLILILCLIFFPFVLTQMMSKSLVAKNNNYWHPFNHCAKTLLFLVSKLLFFFTLLSFCSYCVGSLDDFSASNATFDVELTFGTLQTTVQNSNLLSFP